MIFLSDLFSGSVVTVIIPVIIALLLLFIICSGYVKAPPDTAYIISGLRKRRVLIGKAGVRIPFLERIDKLPLQMISIDVKTTDYVPNHEYINVKVDATVKIRVSQDPGKMELAMANFLNSDEDEIIEKVKDTLEGNAREIVGQMQLSEMVTDRKAFGERVQENATPDLEKMGLEIVSFNVQSFTDEGDVIKNLGIDNVEQIRKGAAIAKAEAARDIAIAESHAEQESNDARVAAQMAIAQRNNELSIKQSELKSIADIENEKALAAGKIQAQEQEKSILTATVNAQIARTEREAELKQKEVQVEKQRLDAEIRAKADADLYSSQKQAEAELYRRQKEAEAKKFECEQEAEAQRTVAEAARFAKEQEAAGITAVGIAEAEAIKAKAIAEAEGIDRKAEAMKKYGEAAVIEMVMNALPEIAKNVAEPLSKVDKITMYGDGNNTKLLSDIVNGTTQVTEGISSGLGLDIKALLAGALGGKLAAGSSSKNDPDAPAAPSDT